MNRWEAIKAHYDRSRKAILAAPKNEWAIDAYAWEPLIRLTPIECWLWGDIRASNAVFYPQWPVDGVFLDFANPVAKVAIECDGAAFHQDKDKDRRRDERLRALGWSVYRITGAQCRSDSDEETGEPGYASRFVEEISEYHGLKRLPQRKAGFDHGFDAVLPLLDHLIAENQP